MNTKNIILYLISIATVSFIIYYIFYTISSKKKIKNSWDIYKNTKSAADQEIISGKNIKRSIDGRYGIEFAYSMWIYIDGWNSDNCGNKCTVNGGYHILNKGDRNFTLRGPEFRLANGDNNDVKFVVKMDYISTSSTSSDRIQVDDVEIGNIPIKKWFHVTVVCINNYIDIYINSFLKKRQKLNGIPYQNYGDFYINSDGGFNGYLSKIKYMNYAPQIWEVEQLYNNKPSEYIPDSILNSVPPYLSYNWWSGEN